MKHEGDVRAAGAPRGLSPGRGRGRPLAARWDARGRARRSPGLRLAQHERRRRRPHRRRRDAAVRV